MSEPDSLPPEVVAELYDRYASDLAAFLLGLLGSHADADEALQATFVKTLEKGHTVDRSSFRAWLFRVAFNEAMLIRRKDQTRKRSLSKLATILDSEESNVARLVSDSELRSKAAAALDQLPEAQQQVVRLRIYEDLTFAKIAEQLGVPLGTVLTRMRLAMKKLVAVLPSEE